jgi:hypothetical protein
VRELLDRFVKKTLNFMKTNETDITMMKSRVTREITSQDKNNAHKQAMLKAELDQQYKNMQDSNDYAQM